MNNTIFWILYAFSLLLRLYSYVMLAQALMSWFVSPFNKLYVFLRRITEPFVGLFRPLSNRLTSRMGMPIDLAFLFAVIALQIIAAFVDFLMRTVWTAGMLP